MSRARATRPSLHRQRRRATLPQLIDRLPLGPNGLAVSPFCLGFVDDPRTVLAAFDAGINFFFVTADMHWPLYDATRRGLAMLFERGGDIRDRVVVGVVSYVAQLEFSRAPFYEVLASIPGLERIECTVIGGTQGSEFMVRLGEYRKHRVNGVIPGVRTTGASFHDRGAAALAVRHGMVDIAFCRYNVVHRGAEVDLFPLVAQRGPTLLYNFTSTQGFMTPERHAQLGLTKQHWRPSLTDYYRFALDRPELDGVLCALSTPRHVRALAEALASGPLTEEEIAYVKDLADLSSGAMSLDAD